MLELLLGGERGEKITDRGILRSVRTFLVWHGIKLDGVGPVDNRPSTDKLHRFVRKKRRRKKVTSDM